MLFKESSQILTLKTPTFPNRKAVLAKKAIVSRNTVNATKRKNNVLFTVNVLTGTYKYLAIMENKLLIHQNFKFKTTPYNSVIY